MIEIRLPWPAKGLSPNARMHHMGNFYEAVNAVD